MTPAGAGPPFTVLRADFTRRAALRLLVRARGGRRVQVVVPAGRVAPEGVEAAIAAALTHLPSVPPRDY